MEKDKATDTTTDFKPCPFCGGNAEREFYDDAELSDTVTCDGCGATNDYWDWNKRSESIDDGELLK